MRILRNLLFFALLLIAADHVARIYAEDRLATNLSSVVALPREPSVEIGGWPFLTQFAAGKLAHVELATDEISSDGIRLTEVDLTLHGVEFSPSSALADRLRSVRIEGGDGTAQISADALEDQLAVAGSLLGDVSIEDLPGVSVEGRTLSLGPIDVRLPVLMEGMTYRSASLEDGVLKLRFGVEPTTLRTR